METSNRVIFFTQLLLIFVLEGCMGLPVAENPGTCDGQKPVVTFENCDGLDQAAKDQIQTRLQESTFLGCRPCSKGEISGTGTMTGYCNGVISAKECAKKKMSEMFMVSVPEITLTTETWNCECKVQGMIAHDGPNTGKLGKPFIPACYQPGVEGDPTFFGDECEKLLKKLTLGRTAKCTVKFKSGETNWEECCSHGIVTPTSMPGF